MKMRLVVALAGLAIGFALPIFAQQTLSPEAVEKADPLAGKFDQASNNNDPAAIAALFAEDAVFVTPDKTIVGPQAIEKQFTEWYQGGHIRNHKTTYDPASYQITGTTDTITFSGGWSQTFECRASLTNPRAAG
jgi:ketosteroid isomerase-like protein